MVIFVIGLVPFVARKVADGFTRSPLNRTMPPSRVLPNVQLSARSMFAAPSCISPLLMGALALFAPPVIPTLMADAMMLFSVALNLNIPLFPDAVALARPLTLNVLAGLSMVKLVSRVASTSAKVLPDNIVGLTVRSDAPLMVSLPLSRAPTVETVAVVI